MSHDKRLPVAADFPAGFTLDIVPPPRAQPAVNLLLLLHGLGDSHAPFSRLAEQLQLPNTASISLRAPNPLPFQDNGWHWCDDVIFDSSTNGLDPDGGFTGITPKLHADIIERVLIQKCHYNLRDVFLFGLGQGGMAALSVAASFESALGGVVSIGGALPAETPASVATPSKTPILIVHGVDSQCVTPSAEEKLKRSFQHVQLSKYRRRGDTMPRDREEMLPIMQFLATHLRTPAPKGMVEAT